MAEGAPEFLPGEGSQIAEGWNKFIKDQAEVETIRREALRPDREFPERLPDPFNWEKEKDKVLEKFWEADVETPLELIVEPHVGAYNDLQCLNALRQTRISPNEYRERVGDFPYLSPSPWADWTLFLKQISAHTMLEELLDDPRIKREHDKRVENWNKKHHPPTP